jgi:hypothetical protein
MNENESNTDTIKTNKSETPSEEEAKYELTFNALWSSATHPVDFPSSPHFSGLIGMTHNGDVQLFAAEKKQLLELKIWRKSEAKVPFQVKLMPGYQKKKQNLSSAEEASVDLREA